MRITSSKGFLTLALFAALAAVPGGQARGQWVQTNGPYGGEADWIIHVGPTVLSNECRSSDGGLHWVQRHPPPYFDRICWFDGKLYGLGSSADPDYVSVDSGITWQVLNTRWPFDHNVPPAFFGDVIMTAQSVRFSLDAGKTWVERDSGLPPYGLTWDGNPRDLPTYDSSIQSSCIAFIGGVAFVALRESSLGQSLGTTIYRSLDTGKHWRQCGADDGSLVTELTGSLSNLFALHSSGISRSTDSGNTWKDERIGLTDSVVETLFLSNSVLYAGTHGGGIFHSLDNGNSWIASNEGLSNLFILSFDTTGTSILAGTLSGIFRSTNEGAHWTCVGFPVVDVRNLVANGPFLLAGSYEMIAPYYKSSIYRSSDNGNVWTPIMQGIYPQCMVTENNDIFMSGEISSSYRSSGLLKSTDHGNTWQKLCFSDTAVTALSVSGSKILAGIYIQGYLYNYYAVYSSPDYGLSWSNVLSDSGYGSFTSFAIRDNVIVAAGERVFRSLDGGATWDTTSVAFDSPASPSAVWNGHAFFVSDYYSMFMSTNDGLTWSRVDSAAGWPGTYQLATYGNIVFDVGAGSCRFSSDDGSSWIQRQDNLSDSTYWGINECAAFNDGYVFVGSDNSVWRRPLSDFGISSVAQSPVPTQPEIHSFPNPFTQSTEITFATQAAGYGEVSIVNALGVEVARLFAGELGIGNHSFTWDAQVGTPAPSGIYWCVVKGDGRVETLPVALVR